MIDKNIGDAILAVFGSPEPDPAHHEHAVRAALEMQTVVSWLNATRSARCVRSAFGVHCGEVVQGYLGTAERMEFTVIGDAVNRTPVTRRPRSAFNPHSPRCPRTRVAARGGGSNHHSDETRRRSSRVSRCGAEGGETNRRRFHCGTLDSDFRGLSQARLMPAVVARHHLRDVLVNLSFTASIPGQRCGFRLPCTQCGGVNRESGKASQLRPARRIPIQPTEL